MQDAPRGVYPLIWTWAWGGAQKSPPRVSAFQRGQSVLGRVIGYRLIIDRDRLMLAHVTLPGCERQREVSGSLRRGLYTWMEFTAVVSAGRCSSSLATNYACLCRDPMLKCPGETYTPTGVPHPVVGGGVGGFYQGGGGGGTRSEAQNLQGSSFREQLSLMSSWLCGWGPGEKALALAFLHRRLSPAGDLLQSSPDKDLVILETQANSPVRDAGTKGGFRTYWNEQVRGPSFLRGNGTMTWLHPGGEKGRKRENRFDAFLCSLHGEGMSSLVSQLLSHLPLLHPGNSEAKMQYFQLLHKVFLHCKETGDQHEEFQQLLLCCLNHPAISNDEKRVLTVWWGYLEGHLEGGGALLQQPVPALAHILPPPPLASNAWRAPGSSQQTPNGCNPGPSITNGDLISPVSVSNGHHCPPSPTLNGHHMLTSTHSESPTANPSSFSNSGNGSSYTVAGLRVMRSNSLTPGTNGIVGHWLKGEIDSTITKPRSLSLQLSRAPLSPQNSHISMSSSSSSSGSTELQADEPKSSFNTEGSGMRDVPMWLKSLRLHKYLHLFAHMTYEEMMGLTEEKLESLGVTKGARHKMVLSIDRLKQRQSQVRQMEQDLISGEMSLSTVLSTLKGILETPIKAYSHRVQLDEAGEAETEPAIPEGDLPGQLMTFPRVLVDESPSVEDCIVPYLRLCDRVMSHEAFGNDHKKRLRAWQVQVQKLYMGRSQKRWNGHYGDRYNGLRGGKFAHSVRGKPPSGSCFSYISQHQGHGGPGQGVTFGILSPPSSSNFLTPSKQCSLLTKRPSLQEPLRPHVTLLRTKSAPIARPCPSLFSSLNIDEPLSPTDSDLNTRLESLCLSVTEHALSGTSDL
ncbi:unnamed protein product [Darwinula stevensoni]|uniref:SAM domain-containing protein n=1 Tax=Darwinula stevensoni TaxID=69355 RepID=A0A7R9A4U3_9CRUS|nr:unnamed protein product [Darwinula stevensoni]CAG0884997.1 unnamed protein product [Darwinula stevensoni]